MTESAPLLLLPGMLTDARLWHHQSPILSKGRPVIHLPVNREDRIEPMAERILAEAPEAFGLAGLSMGGYVALQICRQLVETRRIQRLRYLILVATSARADTPEQFKTRRGLIQLAEKGRFKGVTPKLLPTLIHPSRVHEESLTGLIMRMAEEEGQGVFIRQEKAVMHRRSQLDILPRIPCPVLILCGDSDQRTPPECSREMHAALPDSELHLLAECGHLPPLEKPDQTTARMRAFMDAHQPGG